MKTNRDPSKVKSSAGNQSAPWASARMSTPVPAAAPSGRTSVAPDGPAVRVVTAEQHGEPRPACGRGNLRVVRTTSPSRTGPPAKLPSARRRRRSTAGPVHATRVAPPRARHRRRMLPSGRRSVTAARPDPRDGPVPPRIRGHVDVLVAVAEVLPGDDPPVAGAGYRRSALCSCFGRGFHRTPEGSTEPSADTTVP